METPNNCTECQSNAVDESMTPGIEWVCLGCGHMEMSKTVPFQYEEGGFTLG